MIIRHFVFGRSIFSPIAKRSFSTTKTVVGDSSSPLSSLSPNEFTQFLLAKDVHRCALYFNTESNAVETTHDCLKPLIGEVINDRWFDKHEAIFFEIGQRTKSLLSAFVWNSTRGVAHGGIKLWNYTSMRDLLYDGLKLSQFNGIKASLADLWIGGGQGCISELPGRKYLNSEFRQQLFLDYGDFLSGLNGCFVAADDVGVNVYDMDLVHSRTRYSNGMSEHLGGLGNPAFMIGEAIVCAMEAAVDYLKMGTLQGKNIAVQGAGNVGSVIISKLLDLDVGSVFVTDCSQKTLDDLKDALADKAIGRLQTEKVQFGDERILSRKCDILTSCATGNFITSSTLPKVKARIICGPAYNQLASDVTEESLTDAGIVFIGDYLTNRMSLVRQFVECQGRLRSDPQIKKHFSKDWEHSIFHVSKKILQKAHDEKISAKEAALEVANQRLIVNPLWPNRGQNIIKHLIETEWHLGKDFWRRRSNFPSARNVW